MAVAGGIAMVSGALAGGMFYAAFPIIAEAVPALPNLLLLAPGLIGISLGRNPNGAVNEIGTRLQGVRAQLDGTTGDDAETHRSSPWVRCSTPKASVSTETSRPPTSRSSIECWASTTRRWPVALLEVRTSAFASAATWRSRTCRSTSSRRGHRSHRSERRRQDDAVQRDHRIAVTARAA